MLMEVEARTGLRTVYSELRLISLMYPDRSMESMTLQRLIGSSLSSHNRDLRRLLDLGLIEVHHTPEDRRKKLYRLTDTARAVIDGALHPITGTVSVD